MEKYSELPQDHLLSQSSDCSDDGLGYTMQPKNRRRPLLSWLSQNLPGLIISLLLFYIAVISTINLSWPHTQHDEQSMVKKEYPNLHIEFEDRLEWGAAHAPWNLPPGDELDEAWEDLLYGLNVHISVDEMALINETTENRARVTGWGYAGAMGIWHELHCLNNLRKLIHWDYYGPKYAGTESPQAFGKGHSDHCLDMIRQSLMCRPDTDLYPFSWGEDGIPSPHVKSKTPKQCVKWESLDSWANRRALRPGEFSYIRDKSMHEHMNHHVE